MNDEEGSKNCVTLGLLNDVRGIHTCLLHSETQCTIVNSVPLYRISVSTVFHTEITQ